ncbi:MAG: c-type cytochrome [Deltaproteobacteria bacterium]|nr:c-type cytochrome [Deltaproteobacteria bacterium]
MSGARTPRDRDAWRRSLSVVAAIAIAATIAACPKENKETSPGAAQSGDASATRDGGPEASTAVAFDGRSVVESACLSCHTTEMLEQQRLTPPQWTKVVTKMVTWGATLEAGEVAPLAAYLAERYGLDAGPYELVAVPAAEAIRELSPADDGPFANGDATRGKALFAEKCAACHGEGAKGHVGVNLVERPILHRAADLASEVRKGRGKMPPIPLDDGQVGDVIAHLRTLRVSPPPPPPPPP